MTPGPMETIAPPIIQPLTHPTWHYVNPTSLAASGIYSSEDLVRLRTHIMFPVERPSMVNNIVRGAMGESVPSGSISMLNLLDEDSLNKSSLKLPEKECGKVLLIIPFITSRSACSCLLERVLPSLSFFN